MEGTAHSGYNCMEARDHLVTHKYSSDVLQVKSEERGYDLKECKKRTREGEKAGGV